MLEEVKIINVPPQKVYTFQEKYTYDKLKVNEEVLHKLSSKESDGTLICLGDTFDYTTQSSFIVSYPVAKPDLKKHHLHEFQILPRTDMVLGHFSGPREDLRETLSLLCDYGKKQGREPTLPYRIVYIRGKNLLFTKTPSYYVMDIYVPLQPLDE